MVGVERQKEPAVTGLPAREPGGGGGEERKERESQKELQIWSTLMQLQPTLWISSMI